MTHDHRTLRDLIRQAIADPSSHVERDPGETLQAWCARAVLALLDVDDEWGLVWPPTGDIDWCDNEMEARALATQPQPPELAALRDLGRLRRRFVLTTKPEPVERHRDAEELIR